METLFERLMRGVVTVLNGGSREAERAFIQAFEKIDPEMAEEIKKRLFAFDCIVGLNDDSVQKLLRGIATDDLSKALKAAAPATRDKITRNMSKRAADQLMRTMDETGPMKIDEVEAAQQRIIGVVRTLDAESEIVVPRGRPYEPITHPASPRSAVLRTSYHALSATQMNRWMSPPVLRKQCCSSWCSLADALPDGTSKNLMKKPPAPSLFLCMVPIRSTPP